MIPCAFLRVFRPLDTFGEDERARWEDYIQSGGALRPSRPVFRDQPTRSDGTIGLLSSADGEHADVRLENGRYYVCPWRTRLRVLTGILSVRESAEMEMADAYVPDAVARRAARELARMRRRDPSVRPSILQSAWHVPVRWFVLVRDSERRLVETEPGQYRLSYWTPIGLARRRADRAVQAIRRTELAPVSSTIRELAQWLSAFHLRSTVELDYAGVSSLFSWDELDNDHSAGEIQEAVEALGERDGMARAAEIYQSVAGRWADATARESMN